jgi:chorismate mutase / prephenate dehydratase
LRPWDTPGTTPEADPTVDELRGRIREVDRAILAALNERIGLVAELKRYKESRSIDFLDREQEQRVVEQLADENRGPLSPEGLRALYAFVLDLTKREVP